MRNAMNAKVDSGVTVRPVTRKTFDDVLVPTYAPAAMVPVRAHGLELWDQSGKRYLDFTSGIAVTSLGHTHPALVEALTQQVQTLWHLGNGYTNEPVLRLALALTEATFADRAFFCNSGAEANEAALKLARKYAHTKFGPHKAVPCLPCRSAASRSTPKASSRCRRIYTTSRTTTSKRPRPPSAKTCAP
jgi:succinylornithine aminotransferase